MLGMERITNILMSSPSLKESYLVLTVLSNCCFVAPHFSATAIPWEDDNQETMIRTCMNNKKYMGAENLRMGMANESENIHTPAWFQVHLAQTWKLQEPYPSQHQQQASLPSSLVV